MSNSTVSGSRSRNKRSPSSTVAAFDYLDVGTCQCFTHQMPHRTIVIDHQHCRHKSPSPVAPKRVPRRGNSPSRITDPPSLICRGDFEKTVGVECRRCRTLSTTARKADLPQGVVKPGKHSRFRGKKSTAARIARNLPSGRNPRNMDYTLWKARNRGEHRQVLSRAQHR